MLRVEIWICTTLFALGVIGGMTYLNMTGLTVRPVVENDAQSPLQKDASGTAYDRELVYGNSDIQLTGARVARGDRYLIAGNYALALDQYYEYEESVPDSGTATLLRQALCFELQKQYRRAEQTYNRAVTAAPNIHHQLLGIAGSARCLTRMGKQDESLAIIADQALKIDQHGSVPDEIKAQFAFQFANILTLNAIGAEIDLLDPNSPAFEDRAPIPEVQLKIIDDTIQLADGFNQPAPEFGIKILQQPSNSVNVISASVSAQIKPVLLIVSQLAAASELKLFVSKQATVVVENRSKTVELRSVQFSNLLDTLLGQFDLVWYQIDDELHIVTPGELDPAIVPEQFWFDSAQRAFRRFELSFPDDSRKNLALLSRANLSLIQNRLDASFNQYQELSQTQPHDEILAKLFFNQAKLQMLLGRNDEANRLFYLAVDQSLDPLIESSAYCLLGANLLATGELEPTIRASRRGVATAVNSRQKQHASLTLARAYLLNNDPFSANTALFVSRDSFEDETAKNLASILGSYARYMGLKNETGIRNARNRLLSAIAMIPDSEYSSFADAYLAAHALQELGFTDNAINKYLLALSRPDIGAWQRPILYELALAQKNTGQTSAATTSFRTLAEFDDDQWSRLALHQLAEIFVETSQSTACVETCRRLWKFELTDKEKQTALEILGVAYQQQGEHYSAALCFAGMLPETF